MNERVDRLMQAEGILLIDKPTGCSSFAMVAKARKRLQVKKIGHGGTLDPFASGLLVLLVGRAYTKRASEFLDGDKEYKAGLLLGIATDTFDPEGIHTHTSQHIPSLSDVLEVIASFQGVQEQVPPMFSAKKIGGKRLYELARAGKVIERAPVSVKIAIQQVSYNYPNLDFVVRCSKGTYIRSLADDIGKALGCFAHLASLRRTRSGPFLIADACSVDLLQNPESSLETYMQR